MSSWALQYFCYFNLAVNFFNINSELKNDSVHIKYLGPKKQIYIRNCELQSVSLTRFLVRFHVSLCCFVLRIRTLPPAG